MGIAGGDGPGRRGAVCRAGGDEPPGPKPAGRTSDVRDRRPLLGRDSGCPGGEGHKGRRAAVPRPRPLPCRVRQGPRGRHIANRGVPPGPRRAGGTDGRTDRHGGARPRPGPCGPLPGLCRGDPGAARGTPAGSLHPPRPTCRTAGAGAASRRTPAQSWPERVDPWYPRPLLAPRCPRCAAACPAGSACRRGRNRRSRCGRRGPRSLRQRPRTEHRVGAAGQSRLVCRRRTGAWRPSRRPSRLRRRGHAST